MTLGGVIPSYPSKMQFFLSDSLQNFRPARNNASESENIFCGFGEVIWVLLLDSVGPDLDQKSDYFDRDSPGRAKCI